MQCQILFSGKNKKNISKCRLLKILPRVLSVKQAKHHRWLSQKQAVSSILRSYKSIVTDLETPTVSAHPVGNGLLKSLKDLLIIRSFLFLGDTLPHVTSLSLFFQCRDVNLGIVKATLDKNLRLLQRRKDHDGP